MVKKENRGGKTTGVVSKKKKSEFITKQAETKELLTHHITDKKSKPKPPFLIRSYAIAPDTEQTLENLKQDATDAIGRPISSSALLRALVRFLAQQLPAWTDKQLHPLIEEEIKQGRLWGTKIKTTDRKEIRGKDTETGRPPVREVQRGERRKIGTRGKLSHR